MERLRPVFEPNPKKPKFITDFIEAAMKDGAHEKEKRPKSMTEPSWNKLMDIGLLYNMGPETTLNSVGNLFEYTHGAIIQKSRKFLINLYNNSSQETKDKFKLTEIISTPNLDGSKYPQVFRERMSLAQGGISVKIKDLIINQGITDPKEIKRTFKLNRGQIFNLRHRLKSWGVDLPKFNRDYKQITDEIARENDDKKLQEILDGITGSSIVGFIKTHKDQDSFLFIGNLLNELGFNFKAAHIVGERLRKLEIPVKTYIKTLHKGTASERDVNDYWLILSKHRQRAIDEINSLLTEGIIKKAAEMPLSRKRVDLPRSQKEIEEIVDEIARENDDKKLQKILDSLKIRPIIKFVDGHKDQETFLFIGNLLKELGFSRKGAHIVGARLGQLQIPFKPFTETVYKGRDDELVKTYWTALGKHRKRIVDEINKMFTEGRIKRTGLERPRMTTPARPERKPLEHTLVRFVIK